MCIRCAALQPNNLEEIVSLQNRERELRLVFRAPGFRDLHYYSVDWPKDRPLMITTLDTFDSGDYVKVRRIVSDFIKANTPPNYNIYFAVVSEATHAHDEMERILQSNGDWYQIVRPAPRSTSRISTILSIRRSEAKKRTLMASTRTNAVVDHLFKAYYYEWYQESIVPFIISREDPPSWENQLTNLTGSRDHALLGRDTIEGSHCTMTTLWDHGIILVSDKITRPELDETARRIAVENSLKLTTRDHLASRP